MTSDAGSESLRWGDCMDSECQMGPSGCQGKFVTGMVPPPMRSCVDNSGDATLNRCRAGLAYSNTLPEVRWWKSEKRQYTQPSYPRKL